LNILLEPMWTWRPILSKIKINTVARLYFVCTDHYIVSQTIKESGKQKKWHTTLRFFNFIYVIRKRIVCTSLFSFVLWRVRRYSAFQFLRNSNIANLANFLNIEMGPTIFEKESFVPPLLSFVPQKIQRYSMFQNFKNTKGLSRSISGPFKIQTKVREI